ncbi:hypothetical protein CesoFtcFv8_015529 [Champsocephalus esox]|uniref:Uncharacterized protein n=2 Tax=Champsocephalus TaxID=52236 RepID=A0AAN8DFI1_CHAGU|nr:hypothetical protein CesoFtcFv8_015529 [Champsocephalus esox]KAK5920028.1 hypothetical protein CgunFtcFv8_023871 [Champsocephalus gunnari]
MPRGCLELRWSSGVQPNPPLLSVFSLRMTQCNSDNTTHSLGATGSQSAPATSALSVITLLLNQPQQLESEKRSVAM